MNWMDGGQTPPQAPLTMSKTPSAPVMTAMIVESSAFQYAAGSP